MDENQSQSAISTSPSCYYAPPRLSGTQELTTARLDLRRFKERDAEAVMTWSNDELVLKYFQGRQFENIDEAKCAIGSWREQYSNDDFLLWCVQDAETRGAAGKISANVDSSSASAEVEYSISPVFRGKGYAAEALSIVIDYLHHIGVHRVVARIHVDNVASAKTAERAGMELEGICQHALVDRYGKYYDVAVFAHISDE